MAIKRYKFQQCWIHTMTQDLNILLGVVFKAKSEAKVKGAVSALFKSLELLTIIR